MLDKILALFNDGATANVIALVALLISGRQEYVTWKQKKSDDIAAKEKEWEMHISSIENNLEALVIIENNNVAISAYKAEKISDLLAEFCKKYKLSPSEVMPHYSTIFNYATNDGVDRDVTFEPLVAIRSLIKLLREKSSVN